MAAPTEKLPFDLVNATRPETAYNDKGIHNRVLLDHRLDHRVLDLRVGFSSVVTNGDAKLIKNSWTTQTTANQAIFSVQAVVEDLFCAYLRSHNFQRIHSPKLQNAATESGASVFKVDYFKGTPFRVGHTVVKAN